MISNNRADRPYLAVLGPPMLSTNSNLPPEGDAATNWPHCDARVLDDAMDYAARVSKATVGEFFAAIAPGDDALQIAIEFLVPPVSQEQFTSELDRAMIRRSLVYFAARQRSQFDAVRLTILPPGTFHQWRITWNVEPLVQHGRRWSNDRELFHTILRQAQIGWSELTTTLDD